jgi:hypothetical protein
MPTTGGFIPDTTGKEAVIDEDVAAVTVIGKRDNVPDQPIILSEGVPVVTLSVNSVVVKYTRTLLSITFRIKPPPDGKSNVIVFPLTELKLRTALHASVTVVKVGLQFVVSLIMTTPELSNDSVALEITGKGLGRLANVSANRLTEIVDDTALGVADNTFVGRLLSCCETVKSPEYPYDIVPLTPMRFIRDLFDVYPWTVAPGSTSRPALMVICVFAGI